MPLYLNAILPILLAALFVPAQTQDKNTHDQLPRHVMAALKAKFPKPEIMKWTKEKEGEIFLYDIEFKQAGQKFEADIAEDGAIQNWEKTIPAKNLPSAVRRTIATKYPQSRIEEVMQITAVKSGEDEMEGYEVVLRTRDNKSVEVTIAPDGKMLEDSGEKK